MDINAAIYNLVSSVFAVTARVRSASIAKLHKGGLSADLAFVDVELSLSNDGPVPIRIATFLLVAKILPSAGRFLDIQERYVEETGKSYPHFKLSNELRSLFSEVVFALPEIAQLAADAETAIAANRAGSSAPAQPAPQLPQQLASVSPEILQQLVALLGGQTPATTVASAPEPETSVASAPKVNPFLAKLASQNG